MKESALWKLVLPKWRELGAECTRIETGTERGVPDLHVCWDAHTCWIEGKHVRGLIVMDKRRPEQGAWLWRQRRAGGRAWILARRGDVLRLWDGSIATRLLARGAWNSVPWFAETSKPFDYEGLLRVATGHRLGTQGSVHRGVTINPGVQPVLR